MAERLEKCTADPNFAVICSFLERFALPCGISHPNFLELQEMLENCESVPQPLIDLHVKLLRKARKSVSVERWERAVIKFCHMHAGEEFQQDGWEIERLGYKKMRLDGKLRVLKLLLEHQFDLNTKFKAEVNRLSSSELRLQPFGRDKVGQNYWLQQDEFCNLKVYREDADNETWQVVASDRESLVHLIGQLSEGNLDSVFNSEDSNSHEGLDTGQSSEGNGSTKPDQETSDGDNAQSVKSVSNEESKMKEEPCAEDNNVPETNVSQDNVESKPSADVKEEIEDGKSVTNETDKRLADEPQEERETKRIKLDNDEVSEAIEEPPLIVAGEGSGKECEGENNIYAYHDDSEVGEAIEEPVMFVLGHGSGHECDMGNPTNTEENEKSETTSDVNPKAKVNEGGPVLSTNGTVEPVNKQQEAEDDELDFLKTGFFFGPGTMAAKDRIPMGSPESKPQPSSQDITETIAPKEAAESKLDSEPTPAEGLSEAKPESEPAPAEKPSETKPASEPAPTEGPSETVPVPAEELSETKPSSEPTPSEVISEVSEPKAEPEPTPADGPSESKPESESIPTEDPSEIKPESEPTSTEVPSETVPDPAKVEPKEVLTEELTTVESSTIIQENNLEHSVKQKSAESLLKSETATSEAISSEELVDGQLTDKEALATISPPVESPTSEPPPSDDAVSVDLNSVKIAAKEDVVDPPMVPKEAVADVSVTEPVSVDCKEEAPAAEIPTEDSSVAPLSISAEMEMNTSQKPSSPLPLSSETVSAENEAVTSQPEVSTESALLNEAAQVMETGPVKVVDGFSEEKGDAEDTGLVSENALEPQLEESVSNSVDVNSSSNPEPESDIALKAETLETQHSEVLAAETNASVEVDTPANIEGKQSEEMTGDAQVKVCNTESSDMTESVSNAAIPTENQMVTEHLPQSVPEMLPLVAEAASEIMDETNVAETSGEVVESVPVLDSAPVAAPAPLETAPVEAPLLETASAPQIAVSEIEPIAEVPHVIPEVPASLVETESTLAPPLSVLAAVPVPSAPAEAETTSNAIPAPPVPVEAVVPTNAVPAEEPAPFSAEEALDDEPPAITTLEDAMRQMEAAGAPVRLEDSEDDSDGDDPIEPPEIVHEDDEEEKSFLVFEGATGGWKHATPGQMEEEGQNDVYSDTDQFHGDAEHSKQDPQKKERLKLIPTRGARSNRESAEADPLAGSGDETQRGTKRRSNDAADPTESAEEDDEAKRAKLRGKRTVDRTAAEERRAALGEASSEDVDADADEAGDDAGAVEGDEEGDAAASRRGGQKGRGRGRGRGRGWRARGRGRWGAAARSSTASASTEEQGEAAEGAEAAEAAEAEEGAVKAEAAADAGESPEKKKTPRKSRMLLELQVDMETAQIDASEDTGRGVRTSRRIAQIRLKEQAERKDYEDAEMSLKERLKMEKEARKAAKLEKKRLKEEAAAASDSDEGKKKKKKHKEKKPNFNPGTNVWNQTSSGSSSDSDSPEEEIPEPSDDDAPYVVKSDHEFSPESDVNDEEYQPTRRARTARRDKAVEAEAEPEPQDYPCKKCAKSDQPEWMLLCDKCDAGWHCSCLRPALLQIPEGDWYCPPCQHTRLIASLQEHLQSYDIDLKRIASEEARKKYLSFVDVTVENILPDEVVEVVKKKKKKKKIRERVRGKRRRCQIIDSDKEDNAADSDSENEVDNDDKNDPDAEADESDNSSGSGSSPSTGTPTSSSSSSSSSASDKSSDEDEPMYKLRQRRQTNVNYRFSEYDDLIKSAIQDGLDDETKAAPPAEEVAPVEGEALPIPEKTVKSVGKVLEGEDTEEEEEEEEDSDGEIKKKPQRRGKYLTDEEEDDDGDKDDNEEQEDDEEEEGYLPPIVSAAKPTKAAKGKRKKRSLTALEFSSTSSDPESDEDFKGSSGGEYEEPSEASFGSESDDSMVLSRRKGNVRRSGRYSNRMTRFDREFIDDSSESETASEEDEDSDSDAPRRKKKKKNEKKKTKKKKPPPKKKAAPKSKPKAKPKTKRKANNSDDSDKEVKIKKSKAKAPPKRGQSGSDSDAPAPRRTRGRRMDYREALASSDDEGSGGKEKKKGKDIGKGTKKVEEEVKEVTVTKEKPRTHPRVKVTPLRNVGAAAAPAAPAAAAAAAGAPVPTQQQQQPTVLQHTSVLVAPGGMAGASVTVGAPKPDGASGPAVTITPSTKPLVPGGVASMVPSHINTPARVVAPGIPPSISAVPINPETKAPVGAGQAPRTLKELQQLAAPAKPQDAAPSPSPGAPVLAPVPHGMMPGHPHPGPPGPAVTQGVVMPPTTYPSSASGPLMAMQALAGEAPYPYPPQQYYHQAAAAPPQGPPPQHVPPPHAPYLPTQHHPGLAPPPHHAGHHPLHPHHQQHHPAQHHPAQHHPGQHHHAPPPHHLLHHVPHHPHLPPQMHPHHPHLAYGPPHAPTQTLAQLPPQVPSPGSSAAPVPVAGPPGPGQQEEGRSEFGGLVSYFSSQHDDME